MNVTVVSGFVPLNVLHMSADRYMELGNTMLHAADRAGAQTSLRRGTLEDCWSNDLLRNLFPATETPADRYASPLEHVRSHIVQHTRTQWALEAVRDYPDTDVVVWLDLGILKQGHWNGNPVTPDDVSWFVDMVSMYTFPDIPFPGISESRDVLPHGNNWRFCGSTHVWPVKWLADIDRSYRHELRKFVGIHRVAPLDLAIWPAVETNSGLPFRWYKAEYDASQLRNFPCPL